MRWLPHLLRAVPARDPAPGSTNRRNQVWGPWKSISLPLYIVCGCPSGFVYLQLNVVGRGFRVVKQGIYFLSSDSEPGRNRLAFYSFANASTRILADVDGPLGEGFSVAPDGKTFLFTRHKPVDSDLMLLEP